MHLLILGRRKGGAAWTLLAGVGTATRRGPAAVVQHLGGTKFILHRRLEFTQQSTSTQEYSNAINQMFNWRVGGAKYIYQYA